MKIRTRQGRVPGRPRVIDCQTCGGRGLIRGRRGRLGFCADCHGTGGWIKGADIGEPQRRVTIEPVPETAPVPVPVPAPAEPEPVPA